MGAAPTLGQTGPKRVGGWGSRFRPMTSAPGPRAGPEGQAAGQALGVSGSRWGRAVLPTAHPLAAQPARLPDWERSCIQGGRLSVCVGASQMEIKYLPFGTTFQLERKALGAEDVGGAAGVLGDGSCCPAVAGGEGTRAGATASSSGHAGLLGLTQGPPAAAPAPSPPAPSCLLICLPGPWGPCHQPALVPMYSPPHRDAQGHLRGPEVPPKESAWAPAHAAPPLGKLRAEWAGSKSRSLLSAGLGPGPAPPPHRVLGFICPKGR